MERKLIVTLLQKNIQELAMITEGFMEMTTYPSIIVQLARQKTEDILDYINQLETIKNNDNVTETLIETTVFDNEGTVKEKEIEIIEEVNQEFVTVNEDERAVENDNSPLSENEPFDDKENTEAEVITGEQENFKEIDDEKTTQESNTASGIVVVEEHAILEELIIDDAKDDFPAYTHEQETDTAVASEPALNEERSNLNDRITSQSAEKADNTIAGLHNSKKIDDIRQAISIGDRFRFQRELFDGNGELMNKTLSKLNQLNDSYEAIAYLESKFRWEDDETAESFYQIVRRRFL